MRLSLSSSLRPFAIAALAGSVAVLGVVVPAGAVVAPVSLGSFSTFAYSDGGSHVVAGRGTVSIFGDESDAPRTVALPDADGRVVAAASGAAVWEQIGDSDHWKLGLLDLSSGTPLPLPGADQLPGLGLGPPIIGEMGAQWLRVNLARGAFRLNWHSGERSQASLPKGLPTGRTPQTALSSPTLSQTTKDPYLTFKKGRFTYHRGRLIKRVGGDCSSRCATPIVVGYRVAWLIRGAGKRVNSAEKIYTANVKTGRTATITLRTFPGATPATLNVAQSPPPQFTATGKRLLLSVSADKGATWTIGSAAWPV
jgi:hypothetical protein